MAIKKFLVAMMTLFFVIITLQYALAVDFSPGGDITGRGIYKIYNFTNITASKYCIGALCYTSFEGNASFNQTLTDTLYYPRNTNPQGFYNVSTLPAYPTPDNTSWNESRGNAIYAQISITGDNTTWNQTLANTLYYPINTNPQGFYNISTLPASSSGDNASSINITDDTTSSTVVYPSWVNASSGNLSMKVASTKLNFKPSTGILGSSGGYGNTDGTAYMVLANGGIRFYSTLGSRLLLSNPGVSGDDRNKVLIPNTSSYAFNSMNNVDSDTADTWIMREQAGNIRLGLTAVDTAPVAQSLSVQNTLAGGTSDINGANFTIKGSRGKGTGTGGAILLQTAPAGSSGTVVNPLFTAMIISGEGNVGIGTTAFTQKLDVNGSANFSGTAAKVWIDGSQACTAANGLCTSGEGNASFNQTLTDTLYITTINGTAIYGNLTLHTNQIASLPNISLANINTNMGNYSANPAGYYNVTTINGLFVTTANGTAIYNNISRIDTAITNLQTANTTMNGSISTLITNASNQQAQINSMINLTLAQINTNMGNYSSNPASYYNSTTLPYQTNAAGFSNTTTLITTTLSLNLTTSNTCVYWPGLGRICGNATDWTIQNSTGGIRARINNTCSTWIGDDNTMIGAGSAC